MFSPAGGARRARKAPSTPAKSSQKEHGTDSPTHGLVSPIRSIQQTPGQSLAKHSSLASGTPFLKTGGNPDACDPVFVCDFPHHYRSLVAEAQRSGAQGGMCGDAGLSWIFYKTQLFIWGHLSHASSDCRVLNLPAELCAPYGYEIDAKHGNEWIVRVVTRQSEQTNLTKPRTAGLIMCSKRTLAVAYWPDIYATPGISPIVSKGIEEDEQRSPFNANRIFNSLVSSGLSNSADCVALASCSDGDLWRIDCQQSSGVHYHRVTREGGAAGAGNGRSFGPFDFSSSNAGRSLIWKGGEATAGWRECLLLTSNGVECWDVQLCKNGGVSKAWAFNISSDEGTLADFSGQKQVWLLDVQDSEGYTLTLLAASLSKDRVASSSYMQYSLLTYLYSAPAYRRPGTTEQVVKCLRRKSPAQIILPKARIETEDFLYTMQLRIGGKPAGSAMILAGDGTATISHRLHGVVRLYQFDLPWDAGRVLDASVVPPFEGNEQGAWVVLTEKAGVWAVPEKAVLLGAVEPPERSLSRKGSSNERSSPAPLPRSEVTVAGTQRPLQDEEAEALVGHLFQQFVSTRQADGVLEKLQKCGAFENDGEMNIFARFSKSIVDTIAKQWAGGGGAGAAVMMAISAQLGEKHRRHEQYLNFLAASKCHGVLQQYLRSSLQAVLEHGEKLAAMTKLKDTFNNRSKKDDGNGDCYDALWETIQLVGEKARRKNVMLLDKEKIEVFFMRVSDLEELFLGIEEHGHIVVEQGTTSALQQLYDISDSCTVPLKGAFLYKGNHHAWYPSPEGLTPWYCKASVRAGVWKVASLIMNLNSALDGETKEKLVTCLEGLADVLLESYTGAILAKVERNEEYRGLQTEYWRRRDEIFNVIQQYDRDLAELAAEDKGEQKRLEVLAQRYGSLLSLARRHAGYETLWEICIDLNNMELLRNLMHESMGVKEGRFSNFVFEQFMKMGQHAKLCRLGEEFPEELASFLHGHKSLAWLQDIFLRRFDAASAATHSLAKSNIDPLELPLTQKKSKLAGRRKLLHLAKLSALAAGTPEAREKVTQIDADLGFLDVQELAVELLGLSGDDYISPVELIQLCSGSDERELVIRSLQVFALAGDVFRRSNKILLESAWLRVAEQDDWIKMKEASEEGRWSEEQQAEALRTTAIFAASQLCYGELSSSVVRGLPFEETLPLFSEGNRQQQPGTMAASLVEVLMQHHSFSDAGEAMVMALRMGALASSNIEDGDDMF